MGTCPCCGASLTTAEPQWNIEQARITTQHGMVNFISRRETEVFDLLWRKRGTFGLNANRIVEIICDNDIDGGICPETVREIILRLRRKLAPIGIQITTGTRSGNGYSLTFKEPIKNGAPIEAPQVGLSGGQSPKINQSVHCDY